MIYRRFGRTELQMPVFSCGGMRYQQSWDDIAPESVNTDNQRNIEATILRALELGINHIETARGYGSSEMQLGWILPKLERDRLIVQTKVAPFADPEEFLSTFDVSMRHLQLEHVDLLSIHGINNRELLEWSIRPGGCLEAALRLRDAGRCRYIGFSTHGTNDVILEAIATGDFDYFNVHWYFVNPGTWETVEAARRHDMGVFIISPSDKGGKLYTPPQRMTEACAPLTPMQFNDLYCLARPEVHTLSLGAANPGDFDEHISALAHYEQRETRVASIAATLNGFLEAEHGAAWMRDWQRGIPPYWEIPGEVNIHEILRLWTYGEGLHLREWAKMRYNLLGNAGHWFPGRMAETVDATALAPLLTGSPFRDTIPEILRRAHAAYHSTPKKRLSQGGD